MKRLLLAAGLAIGAHGLLLATGAGWLRRSVPKSLPVRAVTVTLGENRKPPGPSAGKLARRPPHPEPAARKPQLKHRIRKIAPRRPVHRPPPEKPRQKEPKPAAHKPGPEKPRKLARPSPPRQKKPAPSRRAPAASLPAPAPGPTAAAGEGQPESRPRPIGAGKEKDAPRQETAAAAPGVGTRTVLARPLYRFNPLPHYPIMARRREYQGTVRLSVLVDARGRVKDLRVAASSGYELLDQAALDAVREWRFAPGRRGGRPVAMRVEVPVRFVLQ